MKTMSDAPLNSAHVYIREIREQLHQLEQLAANAAGFKSDEWARVLRGAFCSTSTALDLATRSAVAKVRA
jgi:hypothetical protein